MSGFTITGNSSWFKNHQLSEKHIQKVNDATDLQQAMKTNVLDKVKDWFFGTDTQEVCKQLFILFKPQDQSPESTGLKELKAKTEAMVALARAIRPDERHQLSITVQPHPATSCQKVRFKIGELGILFPVLEVKDDVITTKAIPDYLNIEESEEPNDSEITMITMYSKCLTSAMTPYYLMDDVLYSGVQNKILRDGGGAYQEKAQQPVSALQTRLDDNINERKTIDEPEQNTTLQPEIATLEQPQENINIELMPSFAMPIIKGNHGFKKQDLIHEKVGNGDWLTQMYQPLCIGIYTG